MDMLIHHFLQNSHWRENLPTLTHAAVPYYSCLMVDESQATRNAKLLLPKRNNNLYP